MRRIFRNRSPRSPDQLEVANLLRVLDFVQQVAAASEPKKMLRAALVAALELTEAERGWILHTLPEGGLNCVAALNRDGSVIEDPIARISRSVVERTLQQGKAVCFDDVRSEGSFASAQSVSEMRLRAVLAVPLSGPGSGVIYLDNRFTAGVFGERELALLEAYAAPVSLLLERASSQENLAHSEEALRQANRALDARLREQASELLRMQGSAIREPAPGRDDPFVELIGSSPNFLRVVRQLEDALAGDFPVLLRGESGVGKDLCARAFHRVSCGEGAPFVAVHAASLVPQLLEAELFGALRGAFTGVDEERAGLLEQAVGGTLFIDEVAELAPEAQAKLIRLFEDGTYRPLGGGEERRFAGRILVGTRHDLRGEVEAGRFREDLYFRVRVVEVVLPPLRERPGCLMPLWENALAAAAEPLAAEIPETTPRAAQWLQAQEWPGNVRELLNLATRILAKGLTSIRPSDLKEAQVDFRQKPPMATLAQVEAEHIRAVLAAVGGNKAEAARQLGISRRSLYDRLGQEDASS